MRYYLADKPTDLTVIDWIALKNPNFIKLSKKIKPKIKYPNYWFTDGLDFNPELMLSQIDASFNKQDNRDTVFGVEYQRGLTINVNQDWLRLRNTVELSRKEDRRLYNDQFSYRTFNKLWENTEIEKVMKQFKRTPIRSFISKIHANQIQPWYKTSIHKDRILTCETRIVLNLNTHPEFEMQTLKYGFIPSGFKLDQFGKAYVFDSSKVHRAYFTEATNNVRTCVILGFSPWLDYNEEGKYWEHNEFYGELHPFDIISEGHAFSKLIEAK